MKEIQLSQGKVALVDDEDFERVNQYKWYATKSYNTYYAVRNIAVCKNKQTIQTMHYFIMGEKWIDHIEHNGLDNQKHNLRPCTNHQNTMNRKLNINASSKYKGVTLYRDNKRWKSQIQFKYKKLNLGLFISEIYAAKAYDEKAKELFGEFANLNFTE